MLFAGQTEGRTLQLDIHENDESSGKGEEKMLPFATLDQDSDADPPNETACEVALRLAWKSLIAWALVETLLSFVSKYIGHRV